MQDLTVRLCRSFGPDSKTTMRDKFYQNVFKTAFDLAMYNNAISGLNFWAYAGKGRPRSEDGVYWQPGDDLIGDPPTKIQGSYSVYDEDISTKKLIKKYAQKFDRLSDVKKNIL